jgi:hypothetical protein
LLVEHVEYGDRLRLYEEVHSPGGDAQMHGPAVASIAVGKTVGVAPGAELYFIAEQHGTFKAGSFDWDFTWLAQAIERMLEVNSTLPSDRRIRVISISVGWSESQKGYSEAMAAVRKATAQGVFVISTALEATHGLRFHGLGRNPASDANDVYSYGPGSWWSRFWWSGDRRFGPGERLLVPMDSRAMASPTGADDYVFYRNGGWSWCVPWLAGLYALSCEVKPEITPADFWSLAMETGRVLKLCRDGKELDFGTIVDPLALMERLRKD